MRKMTSKFRVKTGPFPKNLDPIKHEIIIMLSAGQKRWTDFESNPRIYSLARSTGPISKALKELVDDGVIKKGFISHKNRPYLLSEDAEALRSLDALEKMLVEIRKTLSNIDRLRDEVQ